jgi:hypothetical protein
MSLYSGGLYLYYTSPREIFSQPAPPQSDLFLYNRKPRPEKFWEKFWKMGGAAARLQSAINTITFYLRQFGGLVYN